MCTFRITISYPERAILGALLSVSVGLSKWRVSAEDAV
jgi:hypothetical protein